MGSGHHGGHLGELFFNVFTIGPNEDGADDRGDHVLGVFRDDERTLPMKWTRYRCQDAPWSTVPVTFFKPSVSVGHDQPHPVQAENLAATVRSNTDGDNDGLGEDAVGG